MADLVDSGLRYCTAHNGVIDCDEERCDFLDITDPTQQCDGCGGHGVIEVDDDGRCENCQDCDGQGATPCTPTPLLYDPSLTGRTNAP